MPSKKIIFPGYLSGSLSFFLFILFFFTSLFFSPQSGFCTDADNNDEIKTGIDAIYNLDFEDARKQMDKIRMNDPEDPAPYFYTAMIYWGKLFFNYDLKAVDELNIWLDRTIDKAEKLQNKEGGESKTLFYLGGAYGFKARISLIKHQWLSAYFNAKKGTKFLQRAVEVNPKNYEAYLGLGMYNYFISRLPGVIKVLAFMLFMDGDKDIGISQLELCAEKGTYGAAEARLVLSSIYIYFENTPDKALEQINILENKYSRNPRFIYMKGIAYSKLKKEDKGLNSALQIEKNIDEGIQNFNEAWRGRTEYLRGEIFFKLEKYELALKHYSIAINTEEQLKSEDWVIQWSYMRSGMIYDATGKREKAKEYYRKALSIDETNEENVYVKDYAKKYLSKPYNPSDPDKLE